MIFSSGISIFDGAVGTELYQRGFYINRPFEELNITAASDVVAVHKSYIESGAEFITTNTFSIPKYQLEKFDLNLKQNELLVAALKNANQARLECGKTNIKIALSIGPTGQILEPLGALGVEDVQREYSQILRLALDSGVPFDVVILETFSNLNELENALKGLRSVSVDIPIIASITVPKSGLESLIVDFAFRMGNNSANALGLNCSEGPSHLLKALQMLLPLTSLPILIQPNAGIPQQINGRYFYMSSPDYIAKYAKRFAEIGASAVGGCCGTGPKHIAAITSALKMSQAKARAEIASGTPLSQRNSTVSVLSSTVKTATTSTRVPFLKRPRSQIGKMLGENKRIISIEVSPPQGIDLTKFISKLKTIEDAGVDFVNIPDNPRANTRISSLHLSVAIANHPELTLSVLPHLTTRDRNLIALQSDLLGAYVNGLTDVLLVTGDPPKLGNNKDATGVYDIDSIGLTYLTDCLNRGVTPSGEPLGSNTHYGIGVAANPTALNLELELQRWKYKCDSGADFAVSQPIYDPEEYLRWIDLIGPYHRPHLVGLWPLVSLRNAEFMANEVPGVKVPTWVIEEMAKAGGDKEESKKRGVAIAQKIFHRLAKECAGFCISAPLGNVNVALEVLR